MSKNIGNTIYDRSINYYETDQMGIVHHSNYIRYFEEARLDMMEQVGLSYAAMEEHGLIIPVLSVACEYIKPVLFGEKVQIHIRFHRRNLAGIAKVVKSLRRAPVRRDDNVLVYLLCDGDQLFVQGQKRLFYIGLVDFPVALEIGAGVFQLRAEKIAVRLLRKALKRHTGPSCL